MQHLKSLITTGSIIAIVVAVVVLVVLLILGWRPVSVGVEAGPISVELAPNSPATATEDQNQHIEVTATKNYQSQPSPTEKIYEATATIFPTRVKNTETSEPTKISDAGKWSGLLDARMPTLNEIRDDMVSIWDANLLDVDDISSPGTRYYDGVADVHKEYLWPFRWCTQGKSLLDQNIDSMQVKFYVNDELVPSEDIFYYHYDNNTGWNCGFWATVLGGWKKGTDISLKLTYTILSEINDGVQNYQPGDYTHQFRVTVK